MISKGKKSVVLCAAVVTALSLSCTSVRANTTSVPGNGSEFHYFSVNSKNQMPNYQNDGAKGETSVAIGPGSGAKFRNGLSVGTNNVNEGYETTVVGSLNKAYGMGDSEYAYGATIVGTGNTIMSNSGILAMGSENIVHEGIAIGAGNNSMGENAVALGNFSSAMYTDSIGIGFGTHSEADAVIAIGRAAKGDALGGVAIGRYAEVHASTGVALGESSVSSRGAGYVGYVPGAVGQTEEEVAAYLGKAEEYKSWKADVEKNKDAYTRAKAWHAAVDAERQAYNEVNQARIAYAKAPTEGNKKALTEKYDTWKKASNTRQKTDVAMRPDFKTINDLNARYGQIFGKIMSTEGAVSVGDEKTGRTRQIINVAAGTKDTDAVNVYQLKNAVESFKKETKLEKDGKYIQKDKTTAENLSALDKQVKANAEKIGALANGMGALDSRVNKVGAGSAALAALHPLDFDPDNKIDFAAGYGHYKGANALAIGAFYRPDENKIISIGGSFGGGENMVSAGVSVKLGQGPGISTSKVAMAKEIKNLKTENKEMKQEIEVLKEQMQKLLAGK